MQAGEAVSGRQTPNLQSHGRPLESSSLAAATFQTRYALGAAACGFLEWATPNWPASRGSAVNSPDLSPSFHWSASRSLRLQLHRFPLCAPPSVSCFGLPG